jgi:hypothetical protein
MRYTGYTEAVPVDATMCNVLAEDMSFQVTGDPDLERYYTNDQLRDMAEEAERLQGNKTACARLPFDGRSLLWDVPYFDFTTLFLVPFAHAFHHGVQKDFQAALLGEKKGGPTVAGMADANRKTAAPTIDADQMVRRHPHH